MQKLANLYGHNLFIIIPPMRDDYKQHIPNIQYTLRHIWQIIEQYKIKTLNFFDDKDFTKEHFGDTDHLNQKGADLLTQKIKKYCNSYLISSNHPTNI
ncbi:hypothetical protein LS70_005970 [Helicobacter sp. MIT 11-5569]|uniref:hypothetical protein n=1 Tax=Helicobacter sp. MIT 11-5569 TaxID=1548151 RepID=UPI00051FD3AF|nr:hypothetical protein [Helicobacter sp. MIT 11-5569]TLD83288.1 hypothetical protein LS70_005970 [Helicobacter sp. MIT 11-5569]